MTKCMVSAEREPVRKSGGLAPVGSRGKAPGQRDSRGQKLKQTTFIIFKANFEHKLMMFRNEKVVKIQQSNALI